jgi:hypothetical protein
VVVAVGKAQTGPPPVSRHERVRGLVDVHAMFMGDARRG